MFNLLYHLKVHCVYNRDTFSILLPLNKIYALIVKHVENFKNFKVHLYFICLLAVRPTSGGKSVFKDTEYWHANTNILFRLRFIHCAMVSPFISYCFCFSLCGITDIVLIRSQSHLSITQASFFLNALIRVRSRTPHPLITETLCTVTRVQLLLMTVTVN